MDFKSKPFIFFLGLVILTKSALSAQYGDLCHTDGDCGDGREFECVSRRCDCISTSNMFYDEELKKCFSYVGKVCSRDSDDRLPEMECVPNAECRKSTKNADFLGFCSCKPKYESENSGRSCVSRLEKTVPKVTSMDQVRPEGWNRSAGSSALQLSKVYQYQSVLIGLTTLLVSIFPFR